MNKSTNINFANEPYPEDLESLLQEAYQIADKVKEKLNDAGGFKLKELYQLVNDKNRTIKENFRTEGFNPETEKEFKGLYVFGEENQGKITPVYVGISRVGFQRLRNHGWGKTPATCTLAFLMAKTVLEKQNTKVILNAKNVDDELHLKPFKKIIRSYKVALIPIKEDYKLYFLEVALAGILKTKWNSFKTH